MKSISSCSISGLGNQIPTSFVKNTRLENDLLNGMKCSYEILEITDWNELPPMASSKWCYCESQGNSMKDTTQSAWRYSTTCT